jgi:pSer/pThr/pTyr-binding forkhead associated (FHA) protein
MDVKLVMFREDGNQREFPLTAKKSIIGRGEDCHIRIPLAEVSRRHLTIDVASGEVTVKDLGSANGTYLNNVRITEEMLSPGDHLIVGPVVFTVQINGDPEEIRPVKTSLKRRQPAASGPPKATSKEAKAAASDIFGLDEDDPISALEALASSADQTAIDPYDEEEELA